MTFDAVSLAGSHLISPVTATSPLSLGPSPVLSMLMLVGLGLLAFVFLMISSFVKIAVVLSILRTAIGLNNIPPASVITGLAIILSIYVMAPTGMAVGREIKPALNVMGNDFFEESAARDRGGRGGGSTKERVDILLESLSRAKKPVVKFLKRHAHKQEVTLFTRMSKRSYREAGMGEVSKSSLVVLIPAFIISELKVAFQIGFLLFIPFLVIDILVSNILMALGMHMLSPTTISLPFKLLLFVMANGWYLLTHGLVSGYF